MEGFSFWCLFTQQIGLAVMLNPAQASVPHPLRSCCNSDSKTRSGCWCREPEAVALCARQRLPLQVSLPVTLTALGTVELTVRGKFSTLRTPHSPVALSSLLYLPAIPPSHQRQQVPSPQWAACTAAVCVRTGIPQRSALVLCLQGSGFGPSFPTLALPARLLFAPTSARVPLPARRFGRREFRPPVCEGPRSANALSRLGMHTQPCSSPGTRAPVWICSLGPRAGDAVRSPGQTPCTPGALPATKSPPSH